LEGVAFGLRDSFELIKEAGHSGISQVRVTGGGARSQLWLQILADILNVELVTMQSEEGAAQGAALLAATGTGAFTDVASACQQALHTTGYTAPGPETQVYEKLYPLYQGLYPALQSTFQGLSSGMS
jgi:xylulokinase